MFNRDFWTSACVCPGVQEQVGAEGDVTGAVQHAGEAGRELSTHRTRADVMGTAAVAQRNLLEEGRAGPSLESVCQGCTIRSGEGVRRRVCIGRGRGAAELRYGWGPSGACCREGTHGGRSPRALCVQGACTEHLTGWLREAPVSE